MALSVRLQDPACAAMDRTTATGVQLRRLTSVLVRLKWMRPATSMLPKGEAPTASARSQLQASSTRSPAVIACGVSVETAALHNLRPVERLVRRGGGYSR